MKENAKFLECEKSSIFAWNAKLIAFVDKPRTPKQTCKVVISFIVICFLGGFLIHGITSLIFDRPELHLIEEYISNCDKISVIGSPWVYDKKRGSEISVNFNGKLKGTYHFKCLVNKTRIKVDWESNEEKMKVNVFQCVFSERPIPIIKDEMIVKKNQEEGTTQK